VLYSQNTLFFGFWHTVNIVVVILESGSHLESLQAHSISGIVSSFPSSGVREKMFPSVMLSYWTGGQNMNIVDLLTDWLFLMSPAE
jgi:hypothetical protein